MDIKKTIADLDRYFKETPFEEIQRVIDEINKRYPPEDEFEDDVGSGMKIDKDELFKLYMEWVDKVSEDNDWKTSFGPKEIVDSIVSIIENNPQLIKNESSIRI